MARPTGRPVRDEILTASQELIQRVGVGAFSYNQLASQLDIKAPSIHHHFRRKEDLVAEVARIYRQGFAAETAGIDGASTVDRLRSYAQLYTQTATSGLNCLCAAIAAEWATTGESTREQVEGFFDDQISWLAAQVQQGTKSGELHANIDPEGMARTLLAVLQGALLLARADRTVTIDGVLDSLLNTMTRRTPTS